MNNSNIGIELVEMYGSRDPSCEHRYREIVALIEQEPRRREELLSGLMHVIESPSSSKKESALILLAGCSGVLGLLRSKDIETRLLKVFKANFDLSRLPKRESELWLLEVLILALLSLQTDSAFDLARKASEELDGTITGRRIAESMERFRHSEN